jgi:hypothetical protein
MPDPFRLQQIGTGKRRILSIYFPAKKIGHKVAKTILKSL